MKTPCLFLLAFLFAIVTFGQSKSVTIESKNTCRKDKLTALLESRKKLKPLRDELVREGKLIHCSDSWWMEDKELMYEIYYVAEDQVKGEAVMKELTKKANDRFPEAVKIIAEACYKHHDTTKNQTILFPVIKSDYSAGVMEVTQIDELPDPTLNYNIVVDFTSFSQVDEKKFKVDSMQVNWGLFNVGRVYNLHAAAGVPPKKINFVLAIHGFPIFSFLNNEEYQKKYKTDNPNLDLIQELSDAGVKFLICGQAMNWMGVKKEQLVPQAKVTLTAQTTITSYQVKGYALLNMENSN